MRFDKLQGIATLSLMSDLETLLRLYVMYH